MWICLQQAWEQESWHSWFHIFCVAETILLCHAPPRASLPLTFTVRRVALHGDVSALALTGRFCVPVFAFRVFSTLRCFCTEVMTYRTERIFYVRKWWGRRPANNKAYSTFDDAKVHRDRPWQHVGLSWVGTIGQEQETMGFPVFEREFPDSQCSPIC